MDKTTMKKAFLKMTKDELVDILLEKLFDEQSTPQPAQQSNQDSKPNRRRRGRGRKKDSPKPQVAEAEENKAKPNIYGGVPEHISQKKIPISQMTEKERKLLAWGKKTDSKSVIKKEKREVSLVDMECTECHKVETISPKAVGSTKFYKCNRCCVELGGRG